MVYVLSFILVVGIIILVHELGHFLAARAVGIRVDRFSIGFGPRLFGFQRGETEYRVAAVPLGGYVKMAGMIDESLENPDDFDPSAPDIFMNKKPWQKVLVVSAGVIMNMILAAVVLTGVYATRGVPSLPEVLGTTIDRPIPGYPAKDAGLQRGDRIVAIDGTPVEKWQDLVEAIYARPDTDVRIDLERNGERQEITLHTKSEKGGAEGEQIGKIGIGPLLTYERVGLGKAIVYGATSTWALLKQIVHTVYMLFAGQASVKDLAGPVGIARVTGETARQGMADLFELLAFISINIGFINILPIPALDGGHLLMVAIEGVRRRPLSTRLKLWIQQIGMLLLFLLIAVVIFNDFMKLR
ncbi:MAG: RIP metalloprotease RseP [Candidatus Eisenbacteria bacterium]